MSDKTFELKGYHVAGIFVSAFAVIIGVNLTLAYNAVDSFPGLEVKNSYVASQQFDTLRSAQEALGWQSSARYDGTHLVVALTNLRGEPVEAHDVAIRVGRPTHGRDDLHFAYDRLTAAADMPLTLDTGAWRVDVRARSADGVQFVTRQTVYVRD